MKTTENDMDPDFLQWYIWTHGAKNFKTIELYEEHKEVAYSGWVTATSGWVTAKKKDSD